MKIRQFIYLGLLILFLADTLFSFRQHYSSNLDGDMAGGIVPANDVKSIFNSPLGTYIIFKNKSYPNPNRFFSHWAFKQYFTSVPHYLQNFTDPITSVYLSCAIAKTIIQLAIIVLLALIISGSRTVLDLNFMISVILITPLFQTNGYRSYMGIIDSSTTYTFFYALPFILLLLYFIPLIRHYYSSSSRFEFNMIIKILWIPLAIIVCLSGPLNPGIVLIIASLALISNIKNNYLKVNHTSSLKKAVEAIVLIPRNYWFYLLPACIFAVYSLAIGRFNSIDIASRIPIGEMYTKLPEGIYYQFFQKLGFPILFLMLIVNAFLIKRMFNHPDGIKILTLYKWIAAFVILYILLVPLGGYRPYRPHILRYDTIMPITISLMVLFGTSSLYLINHIAGKQRIVYILMITAVLIIFTNADKGEFDKNKCERLSLRQVSDSKDVVVKLSHDCTLLSWYMIGKPEDSELNAQLLQLWGVTKVKKLYVNK